MIKEIASLTDAINLGEEVAHLGFIYRGQDNYSSWELKAKIQRPEYQAFLKSEIQAYGQFRQALQHKDLPITKPETKAAGKWLALMQHYGLPTRLLDWTTDFNVGLFFACLNLDLDGALYILNPYPLYQPARDVMLSIPSNLMADETDPFFNFPEARFRHFVSAEGDSMVVPIKPLVPNEREQIQNAVFTVSNNMTMSQDEIIKTRINDPTANFMKVWIKQTAKNDILQFLQSQHRLTFEYLMWPIDSIAKELRAQYLRAN